MQLSDILIDALYNGANMGTLKLHNWGPPATRMVNFTVPEHIISTQMSPWVNSHYSGPGNRFFWATINKAISEIYEPDERSE